MTLEALRDSLGAAPRLGAFGDFGGRFSGELLHGALSELARALEETVRDPSFAEELALELRDYAGRPTPITEALRFGEACGLRVFLKREDLLHGGAHKTNNVIGQGLLALRLGKRRLIAETGAGQHGVATAMIGARLGLEVAVYMGAVDVARQRTNVDRMRLLGATVLEVETGGAGLKDAINEALREWTATVDTTHYCLGTVCGPDPFPRLVRHFQSVIGEEARRQMLERTGRQPDAVAACVGGGSNAIGVMSAFLSDPCALFGVEPAGLGDGSARHGLSLGRGRPGILHGARTYVLQDEDGQALESSSVAAGLDYPAVGPEHAFLKDSGRVTYVGATDVEALSAFESLARTEGIVPALESAHALAFARFAVERGFLARGCTVLVNLSGRGDKDLETYRTHRDGGAR